MLGSGVKIRVGRETGNNGIFFILPHNELSMGPKHDIYAAASFSANVTS